MLGMEFANRRYFIASLKEKEDLRMNTGRNVRRMELTIGELVVSATDAALEVSKNEKRAYQIAGIVVNKILRSSYHKIQSAGLDGSTYGV